PPAGAHFAPVKHELLHDGGQVHCHSPISVITVISDITGGSERRIWNSRSAGTSRSLQRRSGRGRCDCARTFDARLALSLEETAMLPLIRVALTCLLCCFCLSTVRAGEEPAAT